MVNDYKSEIMSGKALDILEGTAKDEVNKIWLMEVEEIDSSVNRTSVHAETVDQISPTQTSANKNGSGMGGGCLFILLSPKWVVD